MNGPCLCGDPWCPSCGGAMGTYRGAGEPDPDQAYEDSVQRALDAGEALPPPPAGAPVQSPQPAPAGAQNSPGSPDPAD